MQALSGKMVVVIGGTSRIGLSAARAFVECGASVVCVGVDEESSAKARSVLGENSRVVMADACHPETTEQAIAVAIAEFRLCDGLYHVADGSRRKYGDDPAHANRPTAKSTDGGSADWKRASGRVV
jgi:NAD(P)-dependent dehydrogenase (short-subunit alcohol dehydrogenase family)